MTLSGGAVTLCVLAVLFDDEMRGFPEGETSPHPSNDVYFLFAYVGKNRIAAVTAAYAVDAAGLTTSRILLVMI